MKFIVSSIVILFVVQSLQMTSLNLKIQKSSLNDKDEVINFFNNYIIQFYSQEFVYRIFLSEEDYELYAQYIIKLQNSLSKITIENSEEIREMVDDCIDDIVDAVDKFNEYPISQTFKIVIDLLEQMFDKLFKILSVTNTNNIKVALY